MTAYRGQAYAVSMFSMEEERRVVIAWRTTMMKWADMRTLEKDKGLLQVRCEPVADRITGAPPP